MGPEGEDPQTSGEETGQEELHLRDRYSQSSYRERERRASRAFQQGQQP